MQTKGNTLIRRLLLIVAAVVLVHAGNRVSPAEPENDGNLEIARRHWAAMRSFTLAKSERESPNGDSTLDWILIARQCRREFGQLAVPEEADRPLSARERTDLEARLAFYVRQFGEGGAEADMRWLLAPGLSQLDRFYKRPENFPGAWPNVDEPLCHQLVLRMYEKPELIGRYWRAYLYGGAISWEGDQSTKFQLLAGLTIDGFRMEVKRRASNDASASVSQYWWNAFNFVLIAHATGRDRLVLDSKPDDLIPAFDTWLDWLRESAHKLEPDNDRHVWKLAQSAREPEEGVLALPPLARPKTPFPDWPDGVEPPQRVLIISRY